MTTPSAQSQSIEDIACSAPQAGGYILADNLRSALLLAIENLKAREVRLAENYRSALRAGLEQNLAYLREHGWVEVRS